MINSVDKLCMGCGACANVCPVNAIKMDYNENNFYMPVVDEDKCIKCGKCLKVCSAIEYKSKNLKDPICYAVSANDKERKESTSGAIFPVLAKYVLNKGGYICGVAWDKNWDAKHIIIDNESDLQKLRFSKYVQATTDNCYKEILNLLKNDKLVLFSGTPCQNAGLLKFLGKDYKNLITVDILCHGAPSPKVWQDYLEKNFEKEKITDINFRNKVNDWSRCCEGQWFYGTSSNITIDNVNYPIGEFYEAFINHRLSNESCLECKYKLTPRPADFTLGDFWHFYKNKEMDDGLGLSVVLLNNKKAEKIFNEIKDEVKFYKKVNLKGHYNWIEINKKSRATKERETLFKHYNSGMDVNACLMESINKHYDIAFCSMMRAGNYGSSLVAYSIYKILESLGKSVLMVNKQIWSDDTKSDKNKINMIFASKYYPSITKKYKIKDDHRELNNLVDSFVIGSDTLWWWNDVQKTKNFFWFDFVYSNKRKISFCTSFAQDKIDIPQEKWQELKYLYSRFDAISTREQSGVDNLKNIFGVEKATHLYDPTLIVDQKIFDEIANESKRTDKNYMVAYILDINSQKEKALKKLSEKLNLELKVIPRMCYKGNPKYATEKGISVEDFVYLFKNADFIVSDSFHGTCFSIIFKKPFYTFVNNARGSARWQIFKDMGLQARLIDNLRSDFTITKQVNFDLAEQIIQKEREKAIFWIKEALQKPINESTKDDLLFDYIISTREESNISDNVRYLKKVKIKSFKIIKWIIKKLLFKI